MSEAESQWNMAIKLNSNNTYIYREWAYALPWDRSSDLIAIAKLQTAVGINPRDPELRLALASRYADLGDTRAEAERQTAATINASVLAELDGRAPAQVIFP